MSLTKISKNELISKLNDNKARYLYELEELYQCENCFAFSTNAGEYCIWYEANERIFCMLISEHKLSECFLNSVIELLESHSERDVLLSIHAASFEESVVYRYGFCSTKCYKCYVHEETEEQDLIYEVILLGKEHEKYIQNTSFPVQKGRPNLQLLFDIFVRENEGSILGVIEKEKLVGYLSYVSSSVTGVMDTDYVYVEPSCRGRKIGTALAVEYVRTVKKRGLIPYWSNAINEVSERTAKAAGFRCCSERYFYERLNNNTER